MNTVEIKAKLEHVFKSFPISREQKEALFDIYIQLMNAALEGVNPDMTQYAKKTDIPDVSGYAKKTEIKTYDAATKKALGLVKQAATITPLEGDDEIATVISTVNTLIANLKSAGIISNS